MRILWLDETVVHVFILANLSVLKKMGLIKLRKTTQHCYAQKYYLATPHLKFACLPKLILLLN